MCCVHVPFRCARAGFVCVHMPREGGKGWKLYKPWWAEDHRRGMAWSYGRMEGPHWKEKGWEGDWKRGANKKLDRGVSGEKLQGDSGAGMTASDGNKYSVGVVPVYRKYCSSKRERLDEPTQIRYLSNRTDSQQEYKIYNHRDFWFKQFRDSRI